MIMHMRVRMHICTYTDHVRHAPIQTCTYVRRVADAYIYVRTCTAYVRALLSCRGARL